MVFDKIKDIIVEQLDVEEDAVTMEASITEDLGADSLDVVDLVMSIEESFDVEIPDEEVENIKTVGDIVKYIENKVEEESLTVSKSCAFARLFLFYLICGMCTKWEYIY